MSGISTKKPHMHPLVLVLKLIINGVISEANVSVKSKNAIYGEYLSTDSIEVNIRKSSSGKCGMT